MMMMMMMMTLMMTISVTAQLLVVLRNHCHILLLFLDDH